MLDTLLDLGVSHKRPSKSELKVADDIRVELEVFTNSDGFNVLLGGLLELLDLVVALSSDLVHHVLIFRLDEVFNKCDRLEGVLDHSHLVIDFGKSHMDLLFAEVLVDQDDLGEALDSLG